MWSVSEKLGKPGVLQDLKKQKATKKESGRRETSEHLLENPNWLVQLSSAEELAGVATL